MVIVDKIKAPVQVKSALKTYLNNIKIHILLARLQINPYNTFRLIFHKSVLPCTQAIGELSGPTDGK